MSEFKTMELWTLEGIIEVKTGLHIGAGKDEIQIGGIDSPVIRRPGTNEPYIPGSSLKGKLRSLAEWSTPGVMETIIKEKTGKPCNCGKTDCPVCVVFGTTAAAKSDEQRGPTRLIVRDAILVPNSKYYYEDKTENVINRIKGKAEHPRHIERVAPGAKFEFSMSYKVLKNSDKQYFKNILLNSMRLLEQDYLGGNGSRGYGKIKFVEIKYKGKKYSNLDELFSELG